MKEQSNPSTKETLPATNQEPKSFVIFLVIIIIGATLRLYNLGAESYWLDEMMMLDVGLG